jgi:hypothetical protein
MLPVADDVFDSTDEREGDPDMVLVLLDEYDCVSVTEAVDVLLFVLLAEIVGLPIIVIDITALSEYDGEAVDVFDSRVVFVKEGLDVVEGDGADEGLSVTEADDEDDILDVILSELDELDESVPADVDVWVFVTGMVLVMAELELDVFETLDEAEIVIICRGVGDEI